MRRFALSAAAAATALLAGSVAAHDLWLQPEPFWIAPRAVAATSVQVGHGTNRERWAVDVARVLSLRSFGPAGGVVDRLPTLRASGLGRDAAFRFDRPGTHVLAMVSGHAVSELPAEQFRSYLAEEGLTPAQTHRRQSGAEARPGREIYSRRAKALIQVGPAGRAAQPQVTRPLGLTLELVPEQNPYTLAPGATLPVRVYYQGRPLAGALVKLFDLAADATPAATARSDAQGRVRITLPRRQGAWLVNVVWTRPLAGDARGDYDTTFSSLTFGWPAAAPPRAAP